MNENYVPVLSGPLPNSLMVPCDRLFIGADTSQSVQITLPVHVAALPTTTLMLYVWPSTSDTPSVLTKYDRSIDHSLRPAM